MNNGENTQEPKRMDDTAKFYLSDIQTRLAVVEEKQRTGEKDRDEMKANDKELKELLKGLDVKLDSYRDEHNLMKGKFAGFWIAVSGTGFLIITFWDWIRATLGALFK